MTLGELSLDGFRNYEGLHLGFCPGLNIISGENAQGKTNLMEAIAYLSGAKSHRARSDGELIAFHRNDASILAKVFARQREFVMDLRLRRGGRRTMLVNHVKLKTSGQLLGMVQSVLFCPEDLALVKEGAVLRRRFMDQAISQLRPKYADALHSYQRLLDHKTRILKDAGEKPSLLSVLEEFNEGLARSGALLIHYRAHFIRRLYGLAEDIAKDFSGGREALSLDYQTVSDIDDPFAPPLLLYDQLRGHQDRLRGAELAARSCLSGPHKDDLLAALDGRVARQFASQGQCRTIALSLKLAERQLFWEDTGAWPILLLDDVLSELDSKRRDFVLERIQGGQVFLTGCEFPPFYHPNARTFSVTKGTVVPLL